MLFLDTFLVFCDAIIRHICYIIDNSVLRHIPHVMTLFDRRVDLARFTLVTPLYVMCREWMWNNPQKMSESNPQSPEPLVFGVPNMLSRPSPPEIHKDSGRVIRLDIPEPHPPHTTSRQQFIKEVKV